MLMTLASTPPTLSRARVPVVISEAFRAVRPEPSPDTFWTLMLAGNLSLFRVPSVMMLADIPLKAFPLTVMDPLFRTTFPNMRMRVGCGMSVGGGTYYDTRCKKKLHSYDGDGAVAASSSAARRDSKDAFWALRRWISLSAS